jgi:probable addiction module antidote protein
MKKRIDYKADLLNDLRNNIGYAAKYLSAAIADSKAAFLVALRDVAEARQGIGQIAAEARINRENLYRTLSEAGNPRLSTLLPVLGVLGMKITVEPEEIISFLGSEKSVSKPSVQFITTGRVVASSTEMTATWGTTTTFAGTTLGDTWDRDVPVFEAPEVPVQLLLEEETSEGFATIS